MRAMQPKSKTALGTMVRETGVKDHVSQPLIDQLSTLSTTLYGEASTEEERSKVPEILNSKFEEFSQAGSLLNPFLEMPGEFLNAAINFHLKPPFRVKHTP